MSFDESGRSSESDVWDDELLVKAYDKASKRVNEIINKRTAKTTALDRHLNENVTQSSVKEWKKGEYCRCVFSDDNEYEAQIMDLCKEKGICRVKYIGYGNEEEQLIAKLMPSQGKGTRKAQEQAVIQPSVNEHIDSSSVNIKAEQSSIPPPPSHFPPLPVREDDALASMLMSWYMSGYHTGYYQALKQMRDTQ